MSIFDISEVRVVIFIHTSVEMLLKMHRCVSNIMRGYLEESETLKCLSTHRSVHIQTELESFVREYCKRHLFTKEKSQSDLPNWFVERYIDLVPLNKALKMLAREGRSILLDSLLEREMLWCSLKHLSIVCRQLALRGMDCAPYLDAVAGKGYGGLRDVILSDCEVYCLKRGIPPRRDIPVDGYYIQVVLGNAQWDLFSAQELSDMYDDSYSSSITSCVLSERRLDLVEVVDDELRAKDVPMWVSDIAPTGSIKLDEVLEHYEVRNVKDVYKLREIGVNVTLELLEEYEEHFGSTVGDLPLFELLKEEGKEYDYAIVNVEESEDTLLLRDYMKGLVYLREHYPQHLEKYLPDAFCEIIPYVHGTSGIYQSKVFADRMCPYRPYLIRKTVEWYPYVLTPERHKELAAVFEHFEDQQMSSWLEGIRVNHS